MVKKLVESIMPSTVFDGDGIPAWGGCYSPRVRRLPVSTIRDQNRSWHTTLRTPNTKISSHLPDLSHNHIVSPGPSIRPSRLSAKIRKHKHRRQLVTVRSVVLADREFFSSCAMVGEKEPNKPDRYV